MERLSSVSLNALTLETPALQPAALADSFATLFAGAAPARVRLSLSDFLIGTLLLQNVRPAPGEPFDRAIAAAARQEAGLDLREFAWDFRLFRAQELSALLFHAPMTFLKRLVAALHVHGVSVDAVEPASSCLLRFLFERLDGLARKNLLLLEVGPLRTLLFALGASDPIVHRIVEGGYAHFAPGARAIDLLPVDLASSDPISFAGRPLDALGGAFRTLAEEIDRTVRGVRIHRGSRHFFDAVHLSGPLSADADFGILIEEICGAPLLAPPPVRIESPEHRHEPPGPWLAAIAASRGQEVG